MRDVANLIMLVLAVLVSVFTVLYLVRSPWEKNEIGRIYAAKSLILTFVLIQGLIAMGIGADYPGRQYVRAGLYGLGVVAYVGMLISLLKYQREDREKVNDE